MLSALAAGVVGLVVCLLLSKPWAALGLCIGLTLGIGNFRLILQSVLKVGRRTGANKRRPLAMNTLSRLMLLTVVLLVIAWFEFPLGVGMILGVALFQFLLLFNVTRAMLKAGAGGPGSGAVLMGLMGGGFAEPDDADQDGAEGPDAAPAPSAEANSDGRGAA